MVTDSYEEKIKGDNGNTLGKITVSVGKPDKYNHRSIGVDYSIYMMSTDTKEDFEERYDYIKSKALRELN